MSYDIDFEAGFNRVKGLLYELEQHNDGETHSDSDINTIAYTAAAVGVREAVKAYPDEVADDPNWDLFVENINRCVASLATLDECPGSLQQATDAVGMMKMHMNRMQGAALSHNPEGVSIRYKKLGRSIQQ